MIVDLTKTVCTQVKLLWAPLLIVDEKIENQNIQDQGEIRT